MPKNKCIIAGSRTIIDYDLVEKAVKASGFKIDEIFSGTAKGADELGELYAKNHNIPAKKFPADWKNLKAKGAVIKNNTYGQYNALAGFSRNEKMASEATHLIAILDTNSGTGGTDDMISRAKAHNLELYIYEI